MGMELTTTTLRRARVMATLSRRSPPDWPSTPKKRRNVPAALRPNVVEKIMMSRSSP